MASQIQNLQYEGYLAEAPEMRYTDGGTAVCNFRIGSNREYKKKDGEKVKETIWLRITAWGQLAEIVNQICDKGSQVIVEGFLRPGENGSPAVYEMKNGKYGASYEVIAEKVRVIKGKDFVAGDEKVIVPSDEDLPF